MEQGMTQTQESTTWNRHGWIQTHSSCCFTLRPDISEIAKLLAGTRAWLVLARLQHIRGTGQRSGQSWGSFIN